MLHKKSFLKRAFFDYSLFMFFFVVVSQYAPLFTRKLTFTSISNVECGGTQVTEKLYHCE